MIMMSLNPNPNHVCVSCWNLVGLTTEAFLSRFQSSFRTTMYQASFIALYINSPYTPSPNDSFNTHVSLSLALLLYQFYICRFPDDKLRFDETASKVGLPTIDVLADDDPVKPDIQVESVKASRFI